MENIIKIIDRLLFTKTKQAAQYQIIKDKHIDTGHKFPDSISVSELLTSGLFKQDIRAILLNLKERGCISNILVLGYDIPWQRAILLSSTNYRFQLKINEKKLKFYKHSLIGEMNDWQIAIVVSDNGDIYLKDNRSLVYHLGDSKKLKIIQSLKDLDTTISSRNLCKKIPYQSAQLLSKEIRNINESLKNKLELDNKFIVNEKNKGYKLNWKSYDIKFEKF
ncbi:MAG: hypothetical protein WC219_06470 [Acholeplasmataceae bacterium]